MASPIGCLTTLDDLEYVETGIRCFEALVRVKKLRNRRSQVEQNEITDMFIATAGCEAIHNSNNGLPKKSTRAEFQRNWRGNKKEYQIKERVSYHGKNKDSGNKTAPR